jgi:hypothetical protein
MEIRLIIVWGREWRDWASGREVGWTSRFPLMDITAALSVCGACSVIFSSLGWPDLMSYVM